MDQWPLVFRSFLEDREGWRCLERNARAVAADFDAAGAARRFGRALGAMEPEPATPEPVGQRCWLPTFRCVDDEYARWLDDCCEFATSINDVASHTKCWSPDYPYLRCCSIGRKTM